MEEKRDSVILFNGKKLCKMLKYNSGLRVISVPFAGQELCTPVC